MDKKRAPVRKNTEEMSTTAELDCPDSGSSGAIISNSNAPNIKSYGSINSETNGLRPASPDSNLARDTYGSTVPTNGSRPTSPILNIRSSNGEYEYEEFDAKLRTYTCPTCAGTGKLTREQQQDLVALIPVRDNRLRPRRTKLKIAIAIFICLVVSVTVAFLLFPREISVTIIAADAYNISIPMTNNSRPFILFKTTYKVSNSNFFTADVKHLSAQITWDNFVVSNTFYHGLVTSVAARSNTLFTAIFNTSYPGVEGKKIRKLCDPYGWSYNLLFMITSTARVSSPTHSEDTSQTRYQYVTCNPQPFQFISKHRTFRSWTQLGTETDRSASVR